MAKTFASTADKTAAIAKVWCWYSDGFIREPELMDRLDRMQVRGGIEGGKFVGYDYGRQCWLELVA